MALPLKFLIKIKIIIVLDLISCFFISSSKLINFYKIQIWADGGGREGLVQYHYRTVIPKLNRGFGGSVWGALSQKVYELWEKQSWILSIPEYLKHISKLGLQVQVI